MLLKGADMIRLDLGKLQKFGVDVENRRIGFFMSAVPEDVEMFIGFDDMTSLISAMFKASEHAAQHAKVVVDLENTPADKFAVIDPTQLDVARQPKSDGHLSFLVGTTALKVNLDSRAMDFLTQLLNQRR